MICSVDAIFSGFAYFLPKTAENKLNDCPLSWPFRHRNTGVSYSQDPSIAIFPLLSGIEALCFPPSFVSPTRTIRQKTAGRTRSKKMRGASTRASSRSRRRWVSEETFRIKKRSFGFRAISYSKDSRIEGHFFHDLRQREGSPSHSEGLQRQHHQQDRDAILPKGRTQKCLN